MEKWRIEISLYKVTLMPLLQICLIVYNKCFFFFFLIINLQTQLIKQLAKKKQNKTKKPTIGLKKTKLTLT